MKTKRKTGKESQAEETYDAVIWELNSDSKDLGPSLDRLTHYLSLIKALLHNEARCHPVTAT
jgi:hypothetical protein